MTPRNQKSAALAMFTTASAVPEAADWRAIAEQLAAVLTTAQRRAAVPADDGFAPWAEKEPSGKGHPFRVVVVTFADGETVRTSLRIPANGRPANIAKACRVACDFYRGRMRKRSGAGWAGGTFWGNPYSATVRFWDGHVAVPEITAVETEGGEARWNPEAATAATEARRAGAWSLSEVETEAREAGMSEGEAAEWIRETFEAEARADLVRRGMITTWGADEAERVALHRNGGLRQTFPGEHPHGWDRKPSNVIPFRRPVAARTLARALSSVAIPDAIGAHPFAA